MTAFAVHGPAAARQWPAIAAALETVFPHLLAVPAGQRGHAAQLVREALRQGHGEIIAVGGDGLVNEAVNGFFELGAPLSPDAVLSIVPCVGVGGRGDIGRAHGLAAALGLGRAHVRTLDLGHVSCLTQDGAAVTRFFLNAASFGITGDIARRHNRARFFLRAWQEARALAAWRPCRVRLVAGRRHDEIAGITALAVMNGSSFGGGLMAAAAADPADGLFDIALLAGAPRKKACGMLRRLRRGTADDTVRRWRCTRLTAAPTIETGGPVWVETDGEAVGILPASFEIVPGAIRVRL